MKQRTSGRLRLWTIISLVLLNLSACEEVLPPYVMPEAVFEAEIIASDLVVDPEEGIVPGGVEFAVDVINILDPQNQFVLNPPYEVQLSITVFIETMPSRKRTIEGSERFDEVLEPGDSVRLFLPFPMTDSDGTLWCWNHGQFVQRFLIFMGRAHIPQVGEDGIDIPTNRKRVRFFNIYP